MGRTRGGGDRVGLVDLTDGPRSREPGVAVVDAIACMARASAG
jgi:hypothetical protein